MLNNDHNFSSPSNEEQHKQNAPEESSFSESMPEAENGNDNVESQVEQKTPYTTEYFRSFDSTSALEIHIEAEKDNGAQLGDAELFEKVEAFINKDVNLLEKDTLSTELDNGLRLFTTFKHARNKAMCKTDAIHTKYFIMQGKVWMQMKAIVKATGELWENWVKENISDFSPSSVKEYKRLAEIPDVMDYIALGKQRLVWLASAIDKEKPQPICSFLEEHKINFKPEEEDEQKIEDAIVDLETVLMIERLKKHKINGADEKIMRGLVKRNTHKGKNFLNDLKIAIESGSDVNVYLDKLLTNKGSVSEEMAKKRGPSHFKDLADKIQKVIKSISGDEELLTKIDKKAIEDLLEALKTLDEKKNS